MAGTPRPVVGGWGWARIAGLGVAKLFSCRRRCRRCCAWMGRLLHTIQSRTNKRNRKGSTVELDAVDHGLHHICLAGGTHEWDTKGMGECSNTLQGHNNNFFFLLWWCNTLKGVSLSMLFFFRRTITFARSKCFALVHNARYRPSVIRGSSFFFVFWGSFHVDFKG